MNHQDKLKTEFSLEFNNIYNAKDEDYRVGTLEIKKKSKSGLVPFIKKRCDSLSQRIPSSYKFPFSRDKYCSKSMKSASDIDIQSSQNGDHIITDSGIVNLDWKYVEIVSNISKFSFIDSYEEFKVNDLVEIEDANNLFGRVAFFLNCDSEYLIGITLNKDINEKLKAYLDKIVFKETCLNKPFTGIVLQSVFVKLFDYPLKLSEIPPILDENAFKFQEETPEEQFVENGFVKMNVLNKVFMYGKIQKNLVINKEHCFEVCLMSYGFELKAIAYVKVSDTFKVLNQIEEITFYDGVVICPSNIISLESYNCKSFKTGDEVHFILRLSGTMFVGTIVHTVSINDLRAAIVQVNESEWNQSISEFKCNEFIFEKLHLSSLDNAYLIPISMLHKEQKKELLATLKYILENECNWQNNIFNEVMAMREESILSYLICNINRDIDLGVTPDLLKTLFDRGDFETLKVLLTKSKLGETSDLTLLELAYECLGDKELFTMLVDKCENRNIILANGETFLTNLLKTNIAEETVVEIIQSAKFDITMCNKAAQSALILACGKLLIPTIKALLKPSKIDQYQIIKATELIYKNDEESDKRFQISKLLNSYKEDDVCSICMDRITNYVFECGHMFCDICADQIDRCPVCSKKLEKRIRMFRP